MEKTAEFSITDLLLAETNKTCTALLKRDLDQFVVHRNVQKEPLNSHKSDTRHIDRLFALIECNQYVPLSFECVQIEPKLCKNSSAMIT